MDLDAVRTFVAAADAGQFQEAAAALSITQQAVSKRIAALERYLDVRLFTRTARGARLTIDGQAFLPHARELLRVEERADASVRPGRRALRVDVVGRRIVTAVLLQGFHRMHPEIELDVVTLTADVDAAIAAVEAGTIDATFHAVTVPAQHLPDAIKTARVIDEPHQLLVGPRHALAAAHAVTPAQLAGHRIWMPGMAPGTEWAAYYDELAAAFGLTIDVVGPSFGNEALLDEIADSSELATLVGEGSRYLWPDSYDLRRIPVRDPTPVYPMSLIWRDDNPHPALIELRAYLDSRRADAPDTEVWMPKWGGHGTSARRHPAHVVRATGFAGGGKRSRVPSSCLRSPGSPKTVGRRMETITGTAAGVPFTALPPAGATEGPAPLIVTWHMLDAPRTDASFAAALPMTRVPAWRVHLGMPMCGARMVDGRLDAILELAREDALMAFLAPFVHQAADEFPAALVALRDQLSIDDEPIGVLGASLGGAVALEVLTTRRAPIKAVALVNPAVRIRSVVGLVRAVMAGSGQEYPWTAESRKTADELDFVTRAADVTAQPPLLLVSGELDHPALRRDAAELVDALRERYAHPDEVELRTVPDLPHPLADEPGLEPAPQLATAKAVDEILTQWFLRQFTTTRTGRSS